ncbi:ParA family protein [Halobium salinum]|uniref:ParA family protein n=1 Tax=Halobium salinum TaxID=1364940 RepID=A0ABD5PHN5_9EURY|nr:ParA family protein [Halobium salinum]
MSSERSEPYPIVVSNQKGGVGKTTVAINAAGALAYRGADVLVVDLDPQGYLTTGVGYDEAYTQEPPSLYDALTDPGEHDVSALVYEHDEFDVLPANIDMFNLEQELVSAMRGRERLSMLLEDVEGYDFVVVDCPPSLGILTDNALLACPNLLIPAEAEDTSIRALDLLFKQIDTLEDNYGTSINERALVVSNVDYPLDGEQKGMLEWFDDTFADRIPVYELRSRAAIKRAFNAGVSMFAHDEDCDQREVLLDLADHFHELAGRQEVAR